MKHRKLQSFQEDFDRLPEEIKRKAEKAFRLFKDNPSHPSLQIEQLEGTKGIWHGWIDYHYRWTFCYESDHKTRQTICVHRRIGKHDIERNP